MMCFTCYSFSSCFPPFIPFSFIVICFRPSPFVSFFNVFFVLYFNRCLQARWQNCEKRLSASSCLSAWNNSAPTRRIFMKFEVLSLFRKTVEKFTFHENRIKITGKLHEDQYIFLVTSRSVLLRMRNVSDKICRENQNTHFVLITFFFNS